MDRQVSQEAVLAELLERCKNGDRQAFARLYETTAPKLYGIVRRICVADEMARDVLQDSYLAIWRNAATFDRSKASVITWMARIARNKAIDARRLQSERISFQGVELDEGIESLDIPADAELERNDRTRQLMNCLQALPEDRRKMIVMAYMNGMTRDEIGETFDRPVNTVKTLLRRSLVQLKDCLDGRL